MPGLVRLTTIAAITVATSLAFGPTGLAARASEVSDPQITKPGSGRYQGRLRLEKITKTPPKTKTKPAKPKRPKPRKACSRTKPNCRAKSVQRKPGKPRIIRLPGSSQTAVDTLLVELQLPDPTPRVGPDPAINEWGVAAVGYPLWLWTDPPQQVRDQATRDGVTFTLQATWLSTTFDTGDGHRFTCSQTPPYPKDIRPATVSPSCGHTYLIPAAQGTYTLSATTNWVVSWQALGRSGTFLASHSGSRELPVGELTALVVG